MPTALPLARPAAVPCAECPLRTRPLFRPFEPEELRFVASFKMGELHVAAGGDILLAGTNSPHLYTILAGCAFRYLILEDGRRQILNFALPGDLLGLQGAVFEQMQHSVEALTDVQLCLFERQGLWRLFREQPGLAFDVTWLAAHEESLVDTNLASVGQQKGIGRVAFLLLHLYSRYEQLGQVSGRRCAVPLTQQHVADATGLSLVHANRILRGLTRQGLIELDGRRLHVPDPERLAAVAAIGEGGSRPRPLL